MSGWTPSSTGRSNGSGPTSGPPEDNTRLERLTSWGLAAQRAGTKGALDETIRDATHPDLMAMPERGCDTLKPQDDPLDRAAERTEGSGAGGTQCSEPCARFSRLVRAEADEVTARDLGVIAAGRRALHCWIAASGT